MKTILTTYIYFDMSFIKWENILYNYYYYKIIANLLIKSDIKMYD